MRCISFHQQDLPAERIGGKVSPRLKGISRSSGLGGGDDVPSVYPSKRDRPDSTHFSPVLWRAPIPTPVDITRTPHNLDLVSATTTVAFYPVLARGAVP